MPASSRNPVLPLVTAIRRRDGVDARASFERELRDMGVHLAPPDTLHPNGPLLYGDRPVGFQRYLDAAEAVDAFPGASELWLSPPQPWTGETRLAFTWFLDDAVGVEGYLVDALLRAARGVVIRTTDGRSTDPVRRVRLALVDLLSKDGLVDGLISHEGDYLAYVRGAIDGALAERGYEADLQPYDDNRPLWLDERVDSLRRQGAPVRNVRAALAGLVAEFWGFDTAARRDPTFWIG